MSKATNLVKLIEEVVKMDIWGYPNIQGEGEKVFPTQTKDLYPFCGAEKVMKSLEQRLNYLQITDILVKEFTADQAGNINVVFSDLNKNEMSVIFSCSEEGCQAIIANDKSKKEAIIIELGALAPSVVKTEFGCYINLYTNEWLNKSTMNTILSAGNLEAKYLSQNTPKLDAYGNKV